MFKFLLCVLFFSAACSVYWVPTGNDSDCWSKQCLSTSKCWRPIQFDVPQVCLDNHVDPNNDREIQTEAGACLVVEPMIVLVLVVVLLVLCIVFMIWRQWERYYWKKREQEERQNPRPWGEYRMPYGDIPV